MATYIIDRDGEHHIANITINYTCKMSLDIDYIIRNAGQRHVETRFNGKEYKRVSVVIVPLKSAKKLLDLAIEWANQKTLYEIEYTLTKYKEWKESKINIEEYLEKIEIRRLYNLYD